MFDISILNEMAEIFFGNNPRFAILFLAVCLIEIFSTRRQNTKIDKAEKEQNEKSDKDERKQADKLDKIWDKIREVGEEQADQSRRMKTHRDHFDVIRKDLDRNLDISNNSNKLSTDAVRMVIKHFKPKEHG